MFNSVFKTGIYAHYTVSSTPSFTNTPWVIYNAKSNKTKQQVSLFKFDKKLFEKYVYESSNASFNNISKSTYKLILAEAISYVRTYVNNMIKFKHPNILSVIEPLEERQNSMIFVTERVTNDLVNFLKENAAKENDNQLILINGLLQVCGALDFLHNNANIIHLNILPSSIFITEKIDFKLSGFNFIEKYKAENTNYNFIAPDERFPKFMSINYDYSDPTLLLDHELSYANDVFSLGCLIYLLLNYKPGKLIINCHNDLYDYKASVNKIKTGNIKYKFDEPYLTANFQRLIDINSHSRISIEEFKNSSFFNNELLNSLEFINNFSSKTLVEKNVFLKGFNSRNFFDKFPKFLLVDKFLPTLKESLASIANLVIFPITLTCIFKISKNLSNLSFINLLIDIFKPILIKSNKKTVELNIISFTEIQIIILDNLKHIMNKINTSTSGNFKKVEKLFLVPLISNVLADGAISIEQLQTEANSNAIQNAFNTIKTLGQVSPEKLHIQEKFLANLSLVISTLQTQSNNGAEKFIETEIFPKVSQVFKQTTSLAIRIEVLNNFILLTKDKILPPSFASKKVIPLLIAIKNKNDMRILQALHKFYAIFLDDDFYDKDLLVETILPELLELTFKNNELTLEKYNEYFQLVILIQNKMKDRHAAYLEKYNDKNIIKDSALKANDNSLDSPVDSPLDTQQVATFESLLSGNKTSGNYGSNTNGNNIDSGMPDISAVNASTSTQSPAINVFSPSLVDSNSSTPNVISGLAANIPPLPSQPSGGDFSAILMPTKKSTVSPSTSILTPKNRSTPLPLSKGLGFNAINSQSAAPPKNTSQLDWSTESTKFNQGKLTLASNNVLQPKTKSRTGNTTGGFGVTSNNITSKQTAVPPGFSAGLIQPTRQNSYVSSSSQKNNPSDDFFDSFL